MSSPARVCALLLATMPTLAVAADEPAETESVDSGIWEVEMRRRVGGLFTVGGWAGVALGTGLMIADGGAHSPSSSANGVQPAPRGPVIVAGSAVFLVVGLSLALPPVIEGAEVQVAATGSGIVVFGRF